MPPDHGIDRVLDRLVVPGYTKVGLAVRRHSSMPADPPPGTMRDKRVIVTGAGGGIGEAGAKSLARLGATVHMLGRSRERLEPAAGRIERELRESGLSPDLELEECDVSDLENVREFAVRFGARASAADSALDAVVHNAGVLPAQREVSRDGHELTVATHVLGPVLMTELLRPQLARSAWPPRVVFVASGGMYLQPLRLDDLEYTGGPYRGATAYARSKRMQVELAEPLSERWAADGIHVYAMHPGWVDTAGITAALPGFSKLMRPLLRSAEDGADTIVWLTSARPAPESGRFWHDRSERPTSYLARTKPAAGETAALAQWVFEAISARGCA